MATFAEMERWVERGDGMQYGPGVIRDSTSGRVLLGHKDNTAGYSAGVWHDVAAGATVAVLTNGHAVDATPIVRVLLERPRAARAVACAGGRGRKRQAGIRAESQVEGRGS